MNASFICIHDAVQCFTLQCTRECTYHSLYAWLKDLIHNAGLSWSVSIVIFNLIVIINLYLNVLIVICFNFNFLELQVLYLWIIQNLTKIEMNKIELQVLYLWIIQNLTKIEMNKIWNNCALRGDWLMKL